MIELTNSELHTGVLRKAWRHQQTRLVLLVTLTAHRPEVDSSNTTDSHKYRVIQRAGSSPCHCLATYEVKSETAVMASAVSILMLNILFRGDICSLYEVVIFLSEKATRIPSRPCPPCLKCAMCWCSRFVNIWSRCYLYCQ